MYKISGIVCIVLMLFLVAMLVWDCNEGGRLDEQLEEATTNFLLVESKHKPIIIEVRETEEEEILILTHEKALELGQKFPIMGSTYFFKDMPWPIPLTITIDSFIEWLYTNDYEIVRKK